MSKRKRCPRKFPEFPIEGPKRTRWSDDDKEQLLAALKKYGYKNLDQIAKDLPQKTLGGIRTMINKLNKEAKKSYQMKDSHIHNWLSSGIFGEHDPTLSQALKFIAMFEDIPKPEECAGCDFRSLYMVLSHVTMGYSPIDISRMSHETLSYVMSQAVHELWPFTEDELNDYIENLQKRKTLRTYSRKPHMVLPTIKQEYEIKREREKDC